MIYFILGVISGSLTFLLPISANCRPPPHQSILCIFHFSLFLTKCIILEMCLVFLVSLPFLAMHIADLLSKTIKGAYSVTMSGSLFNNSWTNILKCSKLIPAVHAALYSLSALDWATGPETCGPIDHGTHVPGPVAQSRAEIEYNKACTSVMAFGCWFINC